MVDWSLCAHEEQCLLHFHRASRGITGGDLGSENLCLFCIILLERLPLLFTARRAPGVFLCVLIHDTQSDLDILDPF